MRLSVGGVQVVTSPAPDMCRLSVKICGKIINQHGEWKESHLTV